VEYLKIRNWDKWQTYRADRGQPPWIKIHRRLMRDPEWVSLSDAERGQLVGMWLLAADRDGVIPASTALIQKLSFMESEPDINKFIELGFICQNDVKATPERRQLDQPKAEKNRIEKNRKEYSVNFLSFWNEYPVKKAKGDAHKSWKKLKPDINVVLLAIKNQVKEKEKLRSNELFCPEWPNPATWLNQLRWEDEDYEITEDDDGRTRFLQRHQDAG
jgi:hypothetical protein